MSKQGFRQSLGLPRLLKSMRHLFDQIPDPKSGTAIPLSDHLMSGLAIFGLKYPSLLQLDHDRSEALTHSITHERSILTTATIRTTSSKNQW